MSETANLLFEIGSEELPPKTLLKLSQSLLDSTVAGLQAAGLSFAGANAYATPRRLALTISDLQLKQADAVVEKRGPAVKAAYAADGSPTKAAEGFAKSCGTTVDQLTTLKTDKGEWLAFNQAVKGAQTADLLPDILRKSIQQLPIAKRMRWGAGETEFARPVHWVVLLLGERVIETEILGQKTAAQTHGHRFHAPQAISVNSPDDYLQTLYEQGKVIVDFERRKKIIDEAAQKTADQVGGIAHIENDLLEEITAINEWPVPVVGNFDQRFLALPVEVLITTMQSNQKYFPVKNAQGDLLPHFITFSNIESSRPVSIQAGNERVILPRLADAEFFWQQDRKLKLEERVSHLGDIVFQKTLGTLLEKTQRVAALSKLIADPLKVDVALAERAATLAKTDLMTEMVGEFASLQGIMGRYYALADGEPEAVAIAQEEQYFPKQSGSPIPSSQVGQVLALAEKIDTLCGIFSAGLIPTGDKDPYALRRATLGILRIVIEGRLQLDIVELVDASLAQFNHDFDQQKTRSLLLDFINDRFKGYCLDHGYRADEFDAVISVKPSQPLDFMQRLEAVKVFRAMPEAESLAAANKRIINILKKSQEPLADEVGALLETQELDLLAAAKLSADDIQPLVEAKQYQQALARLAQLRSSVDAFFDHVMVMCDDLTLRQSRLALLALLSNQFLKIADISKLQQ